MLMYLVNQRWVEHWVAWQQAAIPSYFAVQLVRGVKGRCREKPFLCTMQAQDHSHAVAITVGMLFIVVAAISTDIHNDTLRLETGETELGMQSCARM